MSKMNRYADGSVVSSADELAIARAFGFHSPDAMNAAKENWVADMDRIYGHPDPWGRAAAERKAS